jgi:hypothetical protein
MRQEARGWLFPNDGSKFWLNLPSSFQGMGIGFGGLDGGADLFHRGGQEAEERRGEERRGEERRGEERRGEERSMRAHKNFGSARAQEFWTKHNVILESFQYQLLRIKIWREENIARYRISLK